MTEQDPRKYDIYEQLDQTTKQTSYVVKIILTKHMTNCITKWKQQYSLASDDIRGRGKFPSLKYYYSEGKWAMFKVNKIFYLQHAKMPQRDLLNSAYSFTLLWDQYDKYADAFFKILNNSYNKSHYSLILISFDVYALTFELQYFGKKSFRFRYSLFQFRSSPNFHRDQDKSFQTISCLTDFTSQVQDNQFYQSSRLFFIDDIFDNSIFLRVAQRFYIFYQIYGLNRGNGDNDEFNRRVVNNVYFQTTRLKKFWLTFLLRRQSFAKVWRERDQNRLFKNNDQPYRLSLYLYWDQSAKQKTQDYSPILTLKMVLIDNDRILQSNIKEQIIDKLMLWQKDAKQLNPPIIYSLQRIKRNIILSSGKTIYEDRAEHEEIQMILKLKLHQRVDRCFSLFELIIWSVLQRYYDCIGQHGLERNIKRDEANDIHRFIELVSNEVSYHKETSKYRYSHLLQLTLKNSYVHDLKSESRKTDFTLKIAEWKFHMLRRLTRKSTQQKTEKLTLQNQQSNTLTLHETFIQYINCLLKYQNLRQADRDIIQFVESIIKVCYTPQQQQQDIKIIPARQFICEKIVSTIMTNFIKDQGKLSGDSKFRSHYTRMPVIRLLTKDDFGFQYEDGLTTEITFKVVQFRQTWITKHTYGYLVLRVFISKDQKKWQCRVQLEKDTELINIIRADHSNKKYFQQELQKALNSIFKDNCKTNMIL